jgi:hypothetical protein
MMKLRPPAVPLITIDPYFSIWSMSDSLNTDVTRHWTNKQNRITGTIDIDGVSYIFMGLSSENDVIMTQKSVDLTALSTSYVFEGGNIQLSLTFTSPLILDDLYLLSRPITYLQARATSMDGKSHYVKINISVTDEICLNEAGEMKTSANEVLLTEEIKCIKIGSVDQPILRDCGDDLRINWGYFYLAVKGNNNTVDSHYIKDGEISLNVVSAKSSFEVDNKGSEALFVFAYDDIYSVVYFGEKLKSYWNKDGETIETAILKSYLQFDSLMIQCKEFSNKLYQDAAKIGGEKYADVLVLAYRQSIAAHKIAVTNDGELLFISKECFSNGCAATVDVSYPSIPLFLLYNPELIKGMMRPIFKYAESKEWPYDFAPHDAGVYPHVNGQVYGGGTNINEQMPVEECGNMLIMMAAICIAQKDFAFAKQYMDYTKKWANYLIEYGIDPENQLCTDDFAGHLAHNCNLSIKAIMAIAGFAIICELCSEKELAETYLAKAREMAAQWVKMATNGDGSFRLAFDQPGSFSLKYNMVWDVIFNTNLFPKDIIKSEVESYKAKTNEYGTPLDNRDTYTKSDWLIWAATLADNNQDFAFFVEPLWAAYNNTISRVPMTDWYWTKTAEQRGFQHRSVQGGLFIKMLAQKKICKFYK